MKEYILIFRLNITEKSKQPTPEQSKKYMKDWMQWIDGIASKDQLAEGGNHFSYTVGKVIRRNKISDGPYVHQGEGIAGYIVIFADEIEAATAIATRCPILNGDGVVEVRESATPAEMKQVKRASL
jgi:hypothetical protein